VLGLIGLLIAGCSARIATGGSAHAPPLSITGGSALPGCALSPADSVPPFAALFDESAALRVASSVQVPGALLLSVATDSLGLPYRIRRVEHSLPLSVATDLEHALVVTFVGNPDHRSAAMRVRFDLAPGEAPQVRTASTYHCPPKLINRREITDMLSQAATGAYGSGMAQIWVFANTQGFVQNARVFQSSGSDLVDAVAVGIATKMRFSPATVDDEAVPVWIQIPVAIRGSGGA
jgi:TonB family protein